MRHIQATYLMGNIDFNSNYKMKITTWLENCFIKVYNQNKNYEKQYLTICSGHVYYF